jgi:hypothetical protein
MKITISDCKDCPYYYQHEYFGTCDHPEGIELSDNETLDSILTIPPNCPFRIDSELTIEIKDNVIDPRITCALSMLFEDKKLYEDWLNRPHPEFDGLTPMELINKKQSDIVAEYLEDVLLGHPH